MISDIELLGIDYRTLFLLAANGRIERENDPDRSPGPRFWLAGCASGNVFGIRADVANEIAAEIGSIAASEPPFASHDGFPRHIERYVALLGKQASELRATSGLIYELPHSLRHESRARLIGSESEEGRALHRTLCDRGMPEGMAELGFRVVSDFWPPWCAALVDGEIASVAFAARICDVGAELGLATAAKFRGQGFAAEAVCGWSHLPVLASRRLFYSTDQANLASRRVVSRLGLRFLGASLRIS
ncbi:GNAT family N-acetyltransferase [Aquamicrobium sp. LC103]|uniref:GNAT family N-acetyltransferase n=1 Tax=Aquamicrobium sp. LC103 TaxID=1120658 RepID=UPI00063E75D3|nr:GNAT family N-acetyltransferase [Aquamicrobium sp. LC103]TKT74916.1 GNAT family N-acetyltransferase [Aquamicrobium sp. LC103]